MNEYLKKIAIFMILWCIHHWQKRGKKLLGGVKNFSMFKSKISAFFCTRIHSKMMKTHQSIDNWNLSFVKKIQKKFQNFFFNFSFFQFALSMIFTWHFQVSYLDEFLVFWNDFWCKRKLKSYFWTCKSFLPHPKVFYPLFCQWCMHHKFIKIANFSNTNWLRWKKGG